jgi:hypothetical protein
LRRNGNIGINPFMNIGSIPIDLLNDDLPIKAIFFIKSPTKSGYYKSLFITFLSIEISRVGNELLLVIS